MTYEFKPYGKTERFDPHKGLGIVVTEKMDGSNCGIYIEDGAILGIQSRNRQIEVNSDGNKNDNFGFARWARDNEEELVKLGKGMHFGEWAGTGIQNNPHNLDTKEWFLFNTYRPKETLPDCVNQVPILYQGTYDGVAQLDAIMHKLKHQAKEEERKAEGIIVYWTGFRLLQKYTFQNNMAKWELGQ